MSMIQPASGFERIMSATKGLFARAVVRGDASGTRRSVTGRGSSRGARLLLPLALLAALVTAACGGGDLAVVKPVKEEIRREFTPGMAASYQLPFSFSGGFLPLAASIDGCPGWVTLLPDHGVLAGTAPNEDAGKSFSCTYRVTEADPVFRPQRSVSYGLRLTVRSIDGLNLVGSINISGLSVGTYYNSNSLPQAEGGVPPYTYSFTCAAGQLPSGMSFAPSPPVFAGTPDGRFRDSCTYTVTDSADESFSRVVQIEVTGDGPSLPSVSPINLTVGERSDRNLPPASGGVGPYTYSFTCAAGQLPSGMSFAPSPPVFAGTPDGRFRDSCTYTVTDSADESFSRVIQVTSAAASSLRLSRPVVLGNVLRLRVGERARITFKEATGGVRPYVYELECPDPAPGTFPPPSVLPPGLGFGAQTRVLSGTPEVAYRGPDCTYRVTDSDTPPATDAQSVALIIESERAKWRFTNRSLVQEDQHLNRNNDADPQTVYQLPTADPEHGGGSDGTPVYRLADIRPPLALDPDPKAPKLVYIHPKPARNPPYGITSTYRYQVLFGNTVDDTLCVDVSFRDEGPEDDDHVLIASVRIRDDAYWNGSEWRCPASSLQPASVSHAPVSNPVHTALAPVHARRAVDVANAAVRDRVRKWLRGDSRGLTAIGPSVGLSSLSGETGGFDYSGKSEALSAGAELGAGSWQAGLVASVVRTGLDYRAGPSLRERGYLAGEHDTEFLSVHPFAAWHASSGGRIWVSLGAGAGELRHRDDLGFPFWSRSDASLLSYTAGAAVPVAEVLSGELQAEAGIKAFALEIGGGGRISSSLPTMRGRDYRAGLAWSAPLPGAPSISVAYKHLTGDGGDGGSLETEGSFSVEGVFDPRLSLTGSVEASFGLGDHDQDLWGLGVGLRFAPDGLGRGFGLDVDTRLASPADERSPVASIQGEAGYGLWGGPHFGTVRPYVGVIGDTRHRSVRQSVGLALRETPGSSARIEFREYPAIDRALMFTLRGRR